MTTALELTEAIAANEFYRAQCATRAFLLERRCSGLREDNPHDPRLRDLSKQIDALDELHDRLSDNIGRMKNELRFLADREREEREEAAAHRQRWMLGGLR